MDSLKKWAKEVMDDMQEKFNPTDNKVRRALEEAGVGESVEDMKKRQDNFAGVKRNK